MHKADAAILVNIKILFNHVTLFNFGVYSKRLNMIRYYSTLDFLSDFRTALIYCGPDNVLKIKNFAQSQKRPEMNVSGNRADGNRIVTVLKFFTSGTIHK